MNKHDNKKPKTRWHRLLGALLEQVLSPVGVSVQCDVPIMSNPPEADILLLRRETRQWTEEQRLRLPDGVRDSTASHILLEFKYTESMNESALIQTLAYDFFYKRAQHLSAKNVQSYLLSAKTPKATTLQQFGYKATQYAGVYHSTMPTLSYIQLIILNELSNEVHNAWIKCFASRLPEKKKAFNQLQTSGLKLATIKVEQFLTGLWELWFAEQEKRMRDLEITPEQVMRWGKVMGKTYLSLLPLDERLAPS